MNRDSGYYWVMYRGEWTTARFNSLRGYWSLIGYDGPVDENELDEVGEEIVR